MKFDHPVPAGFRLAGVACGIKASGNHDLSHRGSSFIWGVWHDAKFVADHIATQRKYMAYSASLQHPAEGA